MKLRLEAWLNSKKRRIMMALSPETPRIPLEDSIPGDDLEPVADERLENELDDFMGEMFDETSTEESTGEEEGGEGDEQIEEETGADESKRPIEAEAGEEAVAESNEEADVAAGETEEAELSVDGLSELEAGLDSTFQTITGRSAEVPAEPATEPVATAPAEAPTSPAVEDPASPSEVTALQDTKRLWSWLERLLAMCLRLTRRRRLIRYYRR
jgi:hypothetical protein